MRITDAAGRIGVSRSTAHRLLGMLVYRDFAEQLPDRRYGPGPLMRSGALPAEPVARLREAALPHLRRLVDELGETVNLMVLAGADVRFVATLECDQVLRVGDRTGRTLPAHLASGGKALLAALAPGDLDEVLRTLAAEDAYRLQRQLRAIRRRGFAVNHEETETGVTAAVTAVPVGAGSPPAGISLAMPTARFSRDRLPAWGSAVAAVGPPSPTASAPPFVRRPRERTRREGCSASG